MCEVLHRRSVACEECWCWWGVGMYKCPVDCTSRLSSSSSMERLMTLKCRCRSSREVGREMQSTDTDCVDHSLAVGW